MSDPAKRNKRNTTILMAGLGFAMLALSFASVPLYRLFCQRTGYGGTPQLSLQGANRIEERVITVRFNADTHRELPWEFKPLQIATRVRVGETGLAFYRVRNKMAQPLTGIAIYNVTPDKAALYFHKIHCFCFEEQLIDGNEQVDMPVQFFIDPDIVNDPNCKDLKTITLSYTFFNAKDPNIPAILGLPNPVRASANHF
jgi:cytochrome c oxidase assembly protein subunit 11